MFPFIIKQDESRRLRIHTHKGNSAKQKHVAFSVITQQHLTRFFSYSNRMLCRKPSVLLKITTKCNLPSSSYKAINAIVGWGGQTLMISSIPNSPRPHLQIGIWHMNLRPKCPARELHAGVGLVGYAHTAAAAS